MLDFAGFNQQLSPIFPDVESKKIKAIINVAYVGLFCLIRTDLVL